MESSNFDRRMNMTEAIGFEISLKQPYEQAIEDVTSALKAEGFGILTKIDVKATIKEKLNKDFRPYVILGACNPPLAHRALSHNAEVGLMLPCNVTVEAKETGGALVRVANPRTYMEVGKFHEDSELRNIADEAHAKLLRVIDVLEAN
jgi:uncharacterized protein (DUF302 family)